MIVFLVSEGAGISLARGAKAPAREAPILWARQQPYDCLSAPDHTGLQ